MGYDEGLAHRIRERIEEDRRIAEKKMFGGLAFLVEGAMAFGIIGDELMVRVGPDRHADSLARPHARPMDFTGRPMRGFVQIEPAGFEDDAELQRWLELGIDYAASQAGRTVRARKAERGGPDEPAKGGRGPGERRKQPKSRVGR